MRKIYLFALLILQVVIVQAQSIEATTVTGQKVILYPNNTWDYVNNIALKQITPATWVTGLYRQSEAPNDITVSHSKYLLSYDPNYRLAAWVSYELTDEMLRVYPRVSRTDKFMMDPLIKREISAMDRDYKKSGYDRGHLCPAADMSDSESSMAETFYYTNMSPQKPGFNRGIWKNLEEKVRIWAMENDKIYVVTGPVLRPQYITEENNLFVPKYFYKVILDYQNPGVKGIGFILPNEGSSEDLSKFAVSIDSVEKFTGIDFFQSLPDNHEAIIESVCNYSAWNVSSSTTGNNATNYYKSATKETNQTIKDTTISNEHGRCKAITQAGSQCKRNAEAGSDYCWQHKGNSEVKESSSPSNTYNGSREIHTGPRGGRYYINSSGKKTYIKRK